MLRNKIKSLRQKKTAIKIQRSDNHIMLYLQGAWSIHSLDLVDDELRAIENWHADRLTIIMEDVTQFDISGAWLIERLVAAFKRRHAKVFFKNVPEQWHALMDSIEKNQEISVVDAAIIQERDKKKLLWNFVSHVGRIIVSSWRDILLAMNILGTIVTAIFFHNKKRFKVTFPAFINQIDKMGVGAVPIIILMSFIVGAIIAQQGAFQLRNFGAEIFVVDLVGILVFRELGVLLTAIMIAGRSGSAITAEIGSMKMREETDALKVMGLNPIIILIVPRLVALLIVLPLLTIIADIAALFGAAVVANIYSNIPLDTFWSRLKDIIWLSTYFAGLIKAPFMALIIGIIASVEGLKVSGSSESLGIRVTSSVVKSIFIVIVIDGFFAIFYGLINF